MLFFSSLSPFSDNVRVPVSKEYLLANFGFDTAENEPCKVCPLSVYSFPRSVLAGAGESSLISGKHHVDQELKELDDTEQSFQRWLRLLRQLAPSAV